jgi:hypothetical protein
MKVYIEVKVYVNINRNYLATDYPLSLEKATLQGYSFTSKGMTI